MKKMLKEDDDFKKFVEEKRSCEITIKLDGTMVDIHAEGSKESILIALNLTLKSFKERNNISDEKEKIIMSNIGNVREEK